MPTLLLVTATKTEAQAVLDVFTQATGQPWQRKPIGDKTYYALGEIGGAEILMVQSEMGTATPGGSLITIHKAIESIRPTAVIMVGIAFGTRPDKHKMGDVLVSQQIMAYEPGKIKGKFTPRGVRVNASTRLLDKFHSGDLDWQGAKSDNAQAQCPSVYFGLIVSGEKLVNDLAFRAELLELEPEAIGGEMEGAGLYTAASDAKVDWILVKAICDWADGNKDDTAQSLAAHNAAEFVRHVLALGGWDNPESKPEPDRAAYENALDSYLRAVIADCRPLRLAGMDEHAGDPNAVRLSLEDVYVALNTTTPIEEKGKTKREESRPLSVLEALVKAPQRRMVLVGFPGTGKSTFVRYLALRMTQELRDGERKLDWPPPPLLPVAVSLARLAETLPPSARRGQAQMVERFLQSTLEADTRTAAFAPYLLPALKRSGGLLLFDGLDEVADLSLRPLVVQAVEDFAEQYAHCNPNSRFLVTCRTFSYTDPRWQLTAWPRYELALLDQKQIEQFVAAWYEQHARLDPGRAALYARKREKLLEALRPDDRRRLYEIAPYPIILTVMAVVHASYELPDSRAQVYEKCVDLLLEKWQVKRSLAETFERRSLLEELQVPRATLDLALREIAFEAHKGREGDRKSSESAAQVTETLLTGVLNDYLHDLHKVQTFLDYCQSANGLLMLQGAAAPRGAPPNAPARRVYVFPHLTFEEYLAARHLGEAGIEEQACDLLRQGFDRWREVFMLLGEHLCFAQPAQGRMEALFQTLAPDLPAEPTEADWRAVWLAGDLLTLYRRVFPRPSRSEARIVASLRRLMADEALALRERAAAADTLDALGWLPSDLYQFIPIPVRATRPLPIAAQNIPGGSPLPDGFWIGKYPVTNAQYVRFLAAPDFAERAHWVDFPKFDEHSQPMDETWGEAGWEWLQQQKGEDGKATPRYWSDPRFGIARCGAPVVGITWYEANAYCRWLLAHWDELNERRDNPGLRPAMVRLPTEAEWVLAAGGAEPGERYPWDLPGQATQAEAEILRRANVAEAIGRTTPVGMYPLGVSQPNGVWDMGGNVWEWQANCLAKDIEALALCGASWLDPRGLAYLTDKMCPYPDHYWFNLGFRLAAFPS